jgi:hypothetical protein
MESGLKDMEAILRREKVLYAKSNNQKLVQIGNLFYIIVLYYISNKA